MSGIIRPGDEPQPAHGTYSLHLYSPTAVATVQSTHFIDIADSWIPVVELEGQNSSGCVLELAGHLRVIDGDGNTQLSYVAVSIGGLR